MGQLLPLIVAAVAIALLTPAGAQDKPEMPKLRLAVGGKSAIFYLPLSITERLGYFRDAGLDVEIADVQSGARALQSLVGGSAEVGVGTFDHTIQMQSQGPADRCRHAIRTLSWIRPRHYCIQVHRLSRASEPERAEDPRYVARLEHPFHGGVYAGAQRAQAR